MIHGVTITMNFFLLPYEIINIIFEYDDSYRRHYYSKCIDEMKYYYRNYTHGKVKYVSSEGMVHTYISNRSLKKYRQWIFTMLRRKKSLRSYTNLVANSR